MKILTYIFLLVIGTVLSAQAQTKTYSIPVQISGRVDTTNAEVKEVYALFKNYLEHWPDSIYDNPYWNTAEKLERKGANPAIFYVALYTLQTDPKTIFVENWKPFIMSIEPKNKDKYLLRIALLKDTIAPDKILTILNVNAIKEKDQWVLQNTFHDVVDTWETKKFKNINYYFPTSHKFNDSLAEKATRFCDSIASSLKVSQVKPINYFLCNNPDEMGLLFGFDYYYLNYTTGMTYKWLNQIFSSNAGEYYPHEFVHIVFNDYKNSKCSYLVEEGLACFLGEFGSEKYKWRVVRLAQDYLRNLPTYSLDTLFINGADWNGYQTSYPTGSILAEIIYDKKGFEGIRKLCESPTQNSIEIFQTIKSITGLNKAQFERILRSKLTFYLDNFKFD